MTQFFDAFISYGRADSKAFAQKLEARLGQQGFRVWFDANDIPPAVDYQNQIDDGIEKADNFLFIISPHSVNSLYCLKEIELAVKLNKRIIPLLHVMEISRETWQERNPQGTDEEWEAYKADGRHESYRNMHPIIQKLNWVYFQDGTNDFEKSLADLIGLLFSHKKYVREHTQLLVKALEWERHQKQTSYLLVGEEKQQATAWLKLRFKDEQPPCIPSDLHCEYITESIKNGNNLMTQVFLSYAHEDRGTMEQIRNSLRRESITVWTNTTDIQTGEVFTEAIKRGIEQADNMVYLLSPDSLNSTYCQQELDLAVELNKRIIPVRLRETNPAQEPTALRYLHYIDLTDNVKEEDYQLDTSELLKIVLTDEAYYKEHKILLAKALKWQGQQNNPSILLRGYNLRSAEAWLKGARTRTQHPPTPLQEEFIAESQLRPQLELLDVFISYSRADSDFARKLNDALQIQGKMTWFDQESIASGADFEQEIYDGIKACDNFLFILSPRSVNSPFCAGEVEYAASLNKRFVTVLHQEVNTRELHPELGKVEWIDFHRHQGDFNANFNELVRTLDTDREHLRSHTKWLQRAWDWQQRDKSNDLLLRGSECAVARDWLQSTEEEQKKPGVTGLQKEFIETSQKAIEAAEEAEKRRQAEMLRLQEERTKEVEARLAEQKKSARRQKFLLAAVSVALVAAVGVSVVAVRQQRKALENQIKYLSRLSLVLTKFDRKFEALLEGIRAGSVLKKLNTDKPEIQESVLTALPRAVYEVGEKYVERNRLIGHIRWVNSVAISPDGQTIASSSYDGTVKLWNLQGELLQTLQHGSLVYSVTFSPDGQTIASASHNKTVKLWNSEGELLHTLMHQREVESVAFSPDGKTIASASVEGTIKLWSLGGELLKTFEKQEDRLSSIAFSPDGQTLASASRSGTVKLRNLQGKVLQTFQHEDKVNSVVFSPDGQTIASASDDKTVKLWNKEGKLLQTLQGHEGGVIKVAFSPDGQTIASASSDKTVKLWNSQGELLQTLHGHEDGVRGVAFSPDGQTIASVGIDRAVKLWSLQKHPLQAIWHQSDVYSVAISPNGKTIASASNDTTVKLWNKEGELLHTLKGHKTGVFRVAISPNGQTIASISWDRTLKLWNSEGELVQTLQEYPASIAFSPDSKILASASGDVKLWNKEGKLLQTLQGHEGAVTSVTFSPNGKTIASASADKTVKLWNIEGKLLHTLEGHKEGVNSVVFSPDGKTIASASDDKTIKLWSVEGQLLQTLTGHEDRVRSIAFSPDSKMIASVSYDKTVKLWNLQSQLLQTLVGHEDRIESFAFSPDSKTIASASRDGTIKLWNLQGKLLQPSGGMNIGSLTSPSAPMARLLFLVVGMIQ